MKFIAIKGFASFQHYKKRRPPWIKFYANVLTDAAMMQLPEAAQAQLFKLWLLASQMGHPLPNNQKLLAGKIGVQGKSYIPALIDAGLLSTCDSNEGALADDDENASTILVDREQRTENREQTVVGVGEARVVEGVTPVNVAVWCNTAIADRWGEQTSPLTAGSASVVAERFASVPWALVRDAIGETCRTSKAPAPPRHPNYFAPAIQSHLDRDAARRDADANQDAAPKVIRPFPLPPQSSHQRPTKQERSRAALAAWAAEESNGE